MQWNDILGFLIILFIFLLPLLSKLFTDRNRKQEAPLPVGEALEPLDEELEDDEEEVSLSSPPSFTPPPSLKYQMEHEEFEFHSRLEAKKKKKRSSGKDPLTEALSGRTSLQALMLATQILGEPKSLHDEL